MAFTSSTPKPASYEYERLDAVRECYRFARGASVWRYTSHDADITANLGDGAPALYQSIAIARGGLSFGPEDGRRTLDIRLPRDADLAADFVRLPSMDQISVAIHRHFQSGDNWSVIWTGRVLQVAFQDDQLRLICEPPSVSLKRIALRRLYARNCTHVLYGPECKAIAAPAQASVTSLIDGYSNFYVDDSGIGADYNGGWFIDPAGRMHMIERASNGRIYPLYQSGVAVGDLLTVYKGCDHSLQTCAARFDNADNFGGFPWIPRKNPFANNVF